MAIATNLGFPRIGANRDLKRLVENFWSGKVDAKALGVGAKALRANHWNLQRDSGIADGHIPSNDFSFYDHVLDHLHLFNVIPERYQNIGDDLDTYFAMGRGLQREGVDVPAMEMKKWFDTNYHFIVPEFAANQTFTLRDPKPVKEYLEAKALGISTRPVLLGPITFLHLGKCTKGETFNTIDLLDNLLPAYVNLLQSLRDAGAEWVQLDEPILSFDLPAAYADHYRKAYQALSKVSGLKLLLANYFGRLGDNLRILEQLPVNGLHIDLVRAPEELEKAIDLARRNDLFLSLGVLDGRNIWKADLDASISTVRQACKVLDTNKIFVAASCSLLHVPHSLAAEAEMDSTVRDWLSFATEKLAEISAITKAVNSGDESIQDVLAENRRSLESRRTSPLTRDDAVRRGMLEITEDMFKRKSPFSQRWVKQQEKLHLPKFPTSTVGSFPQTKEVRIARQKVKRGDVTEQEYYEFIKKEIENCVRFQEEIGIDVLVHGEFERNDMVEYFGENLEGYIFSRNGWVQSYGTRCVKPPIIYGDVSRPQPMTVDWSAYAQSLTTKPMKGMLTGPVTMLQWSFVRNDQPRKDTAFQLALAIRKEVQDLEAAGIPAIQIDEPAIREGLPIRRSDWEEYLNWATKAFLLASTGVEDTTQIHTHMCYSDFNDIFTAIQALDADAITIENSKSDLKLLSAFERYGYAQSIGPGLYDIHSPRVPSVEEMAERLQQMLQYLNPALVWVNPDCGLKTRGWSETEAALTNMCEVAQRYRKLSKSV
ncbi:putative 5-methyltetrahydropteroyltriglutamate--homocysteine methyltransferase [Gaertneriomyces semiglobifer]|nr:putative 5-methyltetrahydropteroyltriglutamate--homocysteine methyltransferase [Gaertneriomyces semiglobifer]